MSEATEDVFELLTAAVVDDVVRLDAVTMADVEVRLAADVDVPGIHWSIVRPHNQFVLHNISCHLVTWSLTIIWVI